MLIWGRRCKLCYQGVLVDTRINFYTEFPRASVRFNLCGLGSLSGWGSQEPRSSRLKCTLTTEENLGNSKWVETSAFLTGYGRGQGRGWVALEAGSLSAGGKGMGDTP